MQDGAQKAGAGDTGPRVLVVEDDPGMGQYLRDGLRPLPARVVVVRDGADALARLRAGEAFDLLLTDLKLPGIGGEELIGEIDRDPGLRGLPVLIVTGATEDNECAGRPVLHKPFSGALLRTYVGEVLKLNEGGESR